MESWIESALKGENSKRIRLGMPVNSLVFYILLYCMYMLVLNLLILFRVGIAEINSMMQPHGSGRMEEKHGTCVMCMCVAA